MVCVVKFGSWGGFVALDLRMSSKREEERIEKIIRGLLKLPPNRRCINCNGLGPQYVCTNFWTFVCLTCSGIHREFTHRVKSISMSKFTREEVEALQNGGNQRARDIFLKEWDMQQMRLPDNSKADKIREFIKDVYVNKKYCGGKSSCNPPTDGESPMNQAGPRRADSYHSFSQSPPYDYQYEDRRYGKQFGALTRHTSSDLSRFQGKAASVTYSPGRQHGQLYEDRFANESTGPRMSDFSVSSAGDQFSVQSPNYQDAGYGSPRAHQSKNSPVINVSSQMPNRNTVATFKKDNNEMTLPRRSASSGSVASEGSSMSRKAVDTVGRPLHSRASQMASSSSVLSSSQSPTPHTPGPGQGVFKLQTTQNPKVSSPPPDLLSGFDDEPSFSQPSSTNLFEDKAPSVSVLQNEGWAMFDAPMQPVPVATENVASSMSVRTGAMTLNANMAGLAAPNKSGLAAPNKSGIDAATKPGVSAAVLPGNIPPKGSQDGLTQNNSWWPAAQNLGPNGFSSQTHCQWPLNLHEDNKLVQQNALQLWNAFDDSSVNSSHAPVNLSAEAFQDPVPNAAAVGPEVPFNAAIVGPSFSAPNEHFMAQKSTNPFDLPDDSGSATTSSLFDMNYLQAVLPNSQPNNDFLAVFSQPWFPQNSIPTFHPLPEGLGNFQHIAGQGPNTQLPNLSTQGHIASLGGNPFA